MTYVSADSSHEGEVSRSSNLIVIQNLLAHKHKSWSLGLPSNLQFAENLPLILAVGGGKGGVGKSMMSANIAARLAKLGFAVCAIDMDLGGSNLHTYFGLRDHGIGLSECLFKKRCSLSETLVPTSTPGLSLILNSRDNIGSSNEQSMNMAIQGLWEGLQGLECPRTKRPVEIVLLDLGAGTSQHTIDLFCLAHFGILASFPEPTSIENCYLFMRTFLFRLLENAGKRLNTSIPTADVLRVLSQDQPGEAQSYTERLRFLYQQNPSLVGKLASTLAGRQIGIVLNQTRSAADVQMGGAMEMSAQRYFGFQAHNLGHLSYDEAAWKSLRNRRLLSIDFPQAIVTKQYNDVTANLLKNIGL
jgi:flagellar biosynthesis protein FlhG